MVYNEQYWVVLRYLEIQESETSGTDQTKNIQTVLELPVPLRRQPASDTWLESSGSQFVLILTRLRISWGIIFVFYIFLCHDQGMILVESIPQGGFLMSRCQDEI